MKGKTRLRLPALVAVAALLSGCATTVTPTSGASQGTVLISSFAKSSPGTSPVTIKRDSGFMGAACSHGVYVDGSQVANLSAGEIVTIHLKPGPHIFGARPNFICGGGDAEVEITVREGRSNSVRIGSDQSGSLRIQPTAF